MLQTKVECVWFACLPTLHLSSFAPRCEETLVCAWRLRHKMEREQEQRLALTLTYVEVAREVENHMRFCETPPRWTHSRSRTQERREESRSRSCQVRSSGPVKRSSGQVKLGQDGQATYAPSLQSPSVCGTPFAWTRAKQLKQASTHQRKSWSTEAVCKDSVLLLLR